MERGKEKCRRPRNIRQRMADISGIEYEPHECEHEGDCPGTCPLCDAELQELNRMMRKKGITDLDMQPEILEEMEEELSHDYEPQLAGMPVPPEDEQLMGEVYFSRAIQFASDTIGKM